MKRKAPFRLINFWVEKDGFLDIVKEAWNSNIEGFSLYKVIQKIKITRRKLIQWNKDHVGSVEEVYKVKSQSTSDLLRKLDDDPTNLVLQKATLDGRKEALSAQKDLESFWHQKYRFLWLKEGDQNSKFFYSSIKTIRSRNSIKALQINNEAFYDMKLISEHISDHFEKAFNQTSSEKIYWKSDWKFNKLDNEELNMILKRVTKEEIHKVVFESNRDKAPGLDGFNACFFQSSWEIIKDDVSDAILTFFRNGRLIKEMNRTFIMLVPKKFESTVIQDFIPISLCNFLYKTITKILANRLSSLMPKLIDTNHHAFIKGRRITYAFLLANDIMNDFDKQHPSSKMC